MTTPYTGPPTPSRKSPNSHAMFVVVVLMAALAIYVLARHEQEGNEPGATVEKARWIRTEEANVHQDGNLNSPVIATLAYASKVELLEVSGNWERFSAPSPIEGDPDRLISGWICNIRLLPHRPFGVVTEVADPVYRCEAAIGQEWVDVATANLRGGPGTNHPIVGKSNGLQIVEIHERREGWERISIPGKKSYGKTLTGWIRGDLTAERPTRIYQEMEAKASPKSAPSNRSSGGICSLLSLNELEFLIYKMERPRRRVYVTRAWYGLQYDKKQAVTMYMSECHGLTHVIDSMTGKEVATHNMLGYRIHQ